MQTPIIDEFIENFHKYKLIGSGLVGKIYLSSDPNFIIKKIEFNDEIDAVFPTSSMLLEVAVMSKMKGEANNIQLKEFCFSFPDKTLYIAMEKAIFDGLKLIELLTTKSSYKQEIFAKFYNLVFDFAQGVEQLHRHNILHRDIKLGNIVFDSHMILKLIDYGLSAPNACPVYYDNPFFYTISYRAPEILFSELEDDSEEYTFKTDIWAMGLTILKICFMKHDLLYLTYEESQRGMSEDDILRIVQKNMTKFLAKKEKYLARVNDDRLRNLLRKMLEEDPEKRPDIYEILEDVYFQENGLIFTGKKMKCFDRLILESIDVKAEGKEILTDLKYKDVIKIFNNYISVESRQIEPVLDSAWFLYHMIKRIEEKEEKIIDKKLILAALTIYAKINNFALYDDRYRKIQIKIMEMMEGQIIFSIPQLFINLGVDDKKREEIEKINVEAEYMKVPLSSLMLKVFADDLEKYSDFSREEIINILINNLRV